MLNSNRYHLIALSKNWGFDRWSELEHYLAAGHVWADSHDSLIECHVASFEKAPSDHDIQSALTHHDEFVIHHDGHAERIAYALLTEDQWRAELDFNYWCAVHFIGQNPKPGRSDFIAIHPKSDVGPLLERYATVSA